MTETEPRKWQRWASLGALAWIALLAVVWLLGRSGIPLPRWEGIWRAVKEFGLLIWMLGAAYGWGRLALMRWHTPPGERPNPIWATGLGFGVLWLATLGVAALHLLGPAWPWLLLGGGWLALLATLRPLPRPRWPGISSWRTGEWFLLVVMGASLAYSLVAWALVPPLAWDEISYHLPIPQSFIAAGGLVNLPTIVHSNWPSGMEMLNTLALLMGSEVLPHLIVTAMVVLTAAGLAQFAHRRLDRRTAWLAAALYLAMPMVKFLAGVALIEGALGFFGFLAIWSGYEWLQTRSWPDLVAAGLLGGLAASIKLTGAALPLAVGIAGLVWLVLHDRRRVGRHLAQFAGYGLIALVVVAPWYIRSVANTGNPVWPFLYGLFGGRNWDAVGDRVHTTWLHLPNMAPTVRNFVGGLWYLTVDWQKFGGMSMGAAILALVPLSLLFWRRKRWLLGYLTGTTLIVYTIWFFTTHQTRFLMGIVPSLALLAAYTFSRLLEIWPGWLGALARVSLILYLALGLPFVHADQWQHLTGRWPYVSGNASRQALLAREIKGYDAFVYANEHLPAEAKVLLAIWETRGYYLDREEIWANPISQRVIKWEQFQTPQEVAGYLQRLGLTHVFWYDTGVLGYMEGEEHIHQVLGALLAEYGQVIYQQGEFAIYELEPAP